MRRHFLLLSLIILTACSNSSDFETGEIKAIKNLRDALLASKTPTKILDTRQIITRKKIDDAKIAVLFIELENGQNGTLTRYPGQGVGETWLGADGATVTLKRGVIKATRGMRGDVMGSTSSMPSWTNVKDTSEYSRQISYLGGDNQTYSMSFTCFMKKHIGKKSILVFDIPFDVNKYIESCISNREKIENTYFVDSKNIVRRSIQYHGPALGYLLIERLERQNPH